MTSRLLAATGNGIVEIDGNGDEARSLEGRRVVDLVRVPDGWSALVDDAVWKGGSGEWQPIVTPPGPKATCLLALGGDLLVGTAEAHLVRVAGGATEPVESFDRAEGRERWYTPWGGPPDTRSLAAAPDGAVYVNVHVGGILRSDDDGGSWTPTIDVDADVHQVLAVSGDEVVAATAYGLARSRDRGASWTFLTDGLHATYSRAVAIAGEWLLLSSSTGPGTRQAAIYRRPLTASDDEPFERCTQGLPEWFAGNVDTGCLVAQGSNAALATGSGEVFVSGDAGRTWRQVADGLGRVNRLAFAS